MRSWSLLIRKSASQPLRGVLDKGKADIYMSMMAIRGKGVQRGERQTRIRSSGGGKSIPRCRRLGLVHFNSKRIEK